MKKVTALVLCALLLITSCGVMAAEEDGYAASVFTISDAAPTLANQGVENAYRHNGTGSKAVYYYNYIRRPETLEGDIITEGYPYMCYGTGTPITELNHNILTFNMGMPTDEVVAGDAIYFSFYYRSAETFTGKDGNPYTGNTQQPSVRFDNKTVPMYTLDGGSGDMIADGEWHLAEYYLPITEELYNGSLGGKLSGFQFRISFLRLDLAAYIELAELRCGVLETATPCTDKMAYTYIGRHLQEGKLASLTVDGANVPLKNGLTEYTRDSDSDDPVVEATDTASRTAEVTKTGLGAYEIKAYGPGYDSRFPADTERTYRRALKDGVFSESGAEEKYTVKNADHFGIITLKLNIRPVAAEMTVNGAAPTGAFAAGDVISIAESYRNIRAEDKTYITLLILSKNGQIMELVPFRTTLSASEETKEEAFTYTLAGADYTEVTADMMVIDTATCADVLK